MSTTPDFRDESRGVDPLLAEGLRRLEAGDSSGWRRLLRASPERAVELERHVQRLQGYGFFPATAAPEQVGPYRLLERLGSGGMGVVYRARAEGSTECCAVKIIRPEQVCGEDGRRRLRREVAAASALQHPGIVRVIDVGIDDELPWFAMDLVSGAALSELIAVAREDGGDAVATRLHAELAHAPDGSRLRPWHRLVLEALAQVLDALQHAHDQGVLHRDVKPSNVLVDVTGRAVLIDFGLAHVAAATTITRTGDTLGSLPYMAPELLRSSGEASVASDIYAVGATLHHALGLQLPFVGANAEGVRHGILHSAPRPLIDLDPGLPAAVAHICGQAMSPEPVRRYRSAATFAEDLRSVLAGRVPRARAATLELRLRRWLRRHPLRAVSLAAGFAFAAVLPTSLYWVQSIELRKTTRLSDLHAVGELCTAEQSLWPARPEVVTKADGMDAWLAEADELLGRRARHEADLAAVRARGRRMTEAELAADPSWQRLQAKVRELRTNMVDATTNRTAGWEDWLEELKEHEAPLLRRMEVAEGVAFQLASDERLARNLGTLVLGLEDLSVLRDRVLGRKARVEELRRASLDDCAAAWRETLEAIADVVRNPRYRGLRMEPQFGLVPLGKDPQSGLFEFAHLASGKVPVRGGGGRFTIGEDDSIVLVLLPGGRVRVGADLDPGGPHYDPNAHAEDTPSVEVRLDPFFIGKFEVTQAQWVRQRGHNNCLIKIGSRLSQERPVTGAHPVDAARWLEARRITAQWGLTLPSGAQWEYAARAGTAGARWCGEELDALNGAENLADVALVRIPAWAPPDEEGPFQPADGWPTHAPVGRFRPNPFGLFDVLGNVMEFTIDAARPYLQGLRDGDGCTGNFDAGTARGAAFNWPPSGCQVSRRISAESDASLCGLRTARRIEGKWRQEG
ncbi:MAG: bifunctional serine/threonine-protein kinase/formylglycine-generating enzyme family protein [Planctomycetota bacterium]